jgi:hypothetical protein
MPRYNDSMAGNAVHKNVDFPVANLTATEILTFLPNWLKSDSVCLRFASNELTSEALAIAMHAHRTLPANNTLNNSICVTTHNVMRKAGWRAEYVRSKHWEFVEENPVIHVRKATFDHADISMSWCRNEAMRDPARYGNTKRVQSCLIRDLAQNVHTFPTGADALDLTRVVQYAVTNPQNNWVFPENYGNIPALLGGPKKVRAKHHDAAVLARYEKHARPQVYPQDSDEEDQNRVNPRTQEAAQHASEAHEAGSAPQEGAYTKPSGYAPANETFGQVPESTFENVPGDDDF